MSTNQNRGLIAQEPVAAAGVAVSVVAAVITLVAAFGVDVTAEQRDAVLGFVVAVAVAAPLISAWLGRRKATATINGVVLVDGHTGELVAGEASSLPTGLILEPGATVEDVAP